VSYAPNLVPGDTNNRADVFVRDLEARRTERVSVGNGGAQGNGESSELGIAISADGRFVAFGSAASNLVSDDANDWWDTFVHDRATGTTERVSVGNGGAEVDDGADGGVAISAKGRFVVFESEASDLAPGDTNSWRDVFVRDRVAGTTERVSVGNRGPIDKGESIGGISANGRLVAFLSGSRRLDAFVRDRATATTSRVSLNSRGKALDATSATPTISSDGRVVAFASPASNAVAGDAKACIDAATNTSYNCWDVFVRDRATRKTSLVSVARK
jgi:Tol biopolymer transport system component